MAPEKRRLHPGNGAWKRRLQWHRQWCLQPANGAWKRRLQWRRQWRLKTAPSMARAMAPENSTMAPEIAPELARENWRNGAFNGAGNGAWTGAWNRRDGTFQWRLKTVRKRWDGAPAMAPENGQQRRLKWRLKMASKSAWKGQQRRLKAANNGAWKWPTDWRQTSAPHRHRSSQHCKEK